MFDKFPLGVSIFLVSGIIIATCSPTTLKQSEDDQKAKTCGVSKEVTSSSITTDRYKIAPLGAFPWHASIYYPIETEGKASWTQSCGGTLISDRVVLTAAHCVVGKEPNTLRVGMGKHYVAWDRDEPSQEKLNVSRISIPREYSRNSYKTTHDLALLLLSERVKVSEFIMPACLNSDIELKVNIQDTNLYFVNWRDGSSGDTLSYNSATALSKKECRKATPKPYEVLDKFCALKENSEEALAKARDSGAGSTVVEDGLHYIVGISVMKAGKTVLSTDIQWPTHMIWIKNEISNFNRETK